MLSIIKTAIITIIISFISGVLLDSYKNFAPRILCTMGKPVPLKLNDKNIRAFTLIIRNISNKTIHNLSLNIQGHYDNLKIDGAKITKGLKFETSSENNNYNISISFLSKNDEFSLKLFVESRQGIIKKPIVTLRSPEDFKRVDSSGKNGYLATIAGIPKDISDSITKRKYNKQRTYGDNKAVNRKEKSFFNFKKVLIAIAGIMLVIYAGILGNEYYDKVAGKAAVPNDKAGSQQTESYFGKSNSEQDNTSSITASTSSTSGKNKGSNNDTAKNDKTDTSSTESTKNTSKNASVKPAASGTNKNTKTTSSGSSSKTSSTAEDDGKSQESSNKDSGTDNSNTVSKQSEDKQNSNLDKNQTSPKTNTSKDAEEKPAQAPAEQGTAKSQSNSKQAQSPSQNSPEAGESNK